MQIMTNLMKIASYLAHGILSTGEHAVAPDLLLASAAASLAWSGKASFTLNRISTGAEHAHLRSCRLDGGSVLKTWGHRHCQSYAARRLQAGTFIGKQAGLYGHQMWSRLLLLHTDTCLLLQRGPSRPLTQAPTSRCTAPQHALGGRHPTETPACCCEAPVDASPLHHAAGVQGAEASFSLNAVPH